MGSTLTPESRRSRGRENCRSGISFRPPLPGERRIDCHNMQYDCTYLQDNTNNASKQLKHLPAYCNIMPLITHICTHSDSVGDAQSHQRMTGRQVRSAGRVPGFRSRGSEIAACMPSGRSHGCAVALGKIREEHAALCDTSRGHRARPLLQTCSAAPAMVVGGARV